jgi:hypothetical protein
MKRSLRSRVERHVAATSVLAAAAAVGGAIHSAQATIVYSGIVNIPIPGNVDGVYLNLTTGVSGATAAATPGWDINPYFGANTFFAAAPGYGTVVSGASVANMSTGTVIDGTNATGTVGDGSLFPTSAPGGLYGFRFQDENNGGAVRYGWARIIRGATTTTAGTLVEYAYDDSGAGIPAGITSSNASGACCFNDGTCQPNVTLSACQSAGGSYSGAASCAAANCPPGGSCCMPDTSCSVMTSVACSTAGGVWGGAGSVCTSCSGACCNTDGTCSVTSAQNCAGNSGSTYLGNGSTCASGQCHAISFLPLPLTYNWNGMTTPNTEQGTTNRDDPNGYRSIADRGLLLSGSGTSINAGPVTGTDGMTYTLNTQDHALDIVHLGDRRTVANAARNWDSSGTTNNGAQPSWLLNNDQTTPQASPLSSVTATLTSESRIGVLYQVSDSGGRFDCVLGFTDNSTVTVTMRAPDWFHSQTPPAPGAGMIVQRQLGVYDATDSTDVANTSVDSLNVVEGVISVPRLILDGLGNVAGKRLSSITFQNPVSNANYANSTPATGSGFAILAATLSYPGVGSACYANCDHSTGTPFLNVADFTCFLQKFSLGDPYANCDGSTNPPTLNVADFTCFLQKFSIGCSAP